MGQVFKEGTFELTLAKDNIKAYKLDELEKYRSLCSASLKGVDIVIEDKQEVLWVELKNFYNPSKKEKTEPKDILLNDLCKKYRDTWLFNYLCDEIKKTIKYICVLENIDAALLLHLQDQLTRYIPAGEVLPNSRSILEKDNVLVLNCEVWNTKFSHFGTLEVIYSTNAIES